MTTEEQPVQLCSNCKYGIQVSTIRQCFVDPPTMIGSAPKRPRVNDYEFCSRWWPQGTPILIPQEKIDAAFPLWTINDHPEIDESISNIMEQIRELQRPFREMGLEPPAPTFTINENPLPSIEDQIKGVLPTRPAGASKR